MTSPWGVGFPPQMSAQLLAESWLVGASLCLGHACSGSVVGRQISCPLRLTTPTRVNSRHKVPFLPPEASSLRPWMSYLTSCDRDQNPREGPCPWGPCTMHHPVCVHGPRDPGVEAKATGTASRVARARACACPGARPGNAGGVYGHGTQLCSAKVLHLPAGEAQLTLLTARGCLDHLQNMLCCLAGKG